MNNELVPQPSWWKRNWKWVVPVGGCFTLILIFIAFFASIFFGVSKILSDSQPYEYAFELINKDEQMIKLLGSPIEKDGMIQGNYSNDNGNKTANMTIPISGPKANGTLYIIANGQGEEWDYEEIRVEIKDENVDLLPNLKKTE